MSEITLPSGRVVKLNLNAITIKEYRALFDDHPVDQDDELLAKATGLSVDELTGLGYADYRALVKAFFDTARDPLANPN